jgi:hypothetical protein
VPGTKGTALALIERLTGLTAGNDSGDNPRTDVDRNLGSDHARVAPSKRKHGQIALMSTSCQAEPRGLPMRRYKKPFTSPENTIAEGHNLCRATGLSMS